MSAVWSDQLCDFTPQIAGALPPTDWSGDVTVDLAGTVSNKHRRASNRS